MSLKRRDMHLRCVICSLRERDMSLKRRDVPLRGVICSLRERDMSLKRRDMFAVANVKKET